MNAELIQSIAERAARKHCPKDYLREDAASAAMIRMIEKLPEHAPDRSKLTTFLIMHARYGISEFLRAEFGRKDRGRGEEVCFPLTDIYATTLIPADTAIDIARRLDNIDLAATPTMSQWRGNLPTVETLRRR